MMTLANRTRWHAEGAASVRRHPMEMGCSRQGCTPWPFGCVLCSPVKLQQRIQKGTSVRLLACSHSTKFTNDGAVQSEFNQSCPSRREVGRSKGRGNKSPSICRGNSDVEPYQPLSYADHHDARRSYSRAYETCPKRMKLFTCRLRISNSTSSTMLRKWRDWIMSAEGLEAAWCALDRR